MKTLMLLAAAALCLSACSGQNTNISTLQFSGDTIAFPAQYEVEAARVVRDRRGDRSRVRVSVPRPILGQSVFEPKRWYSCLRGMPAKPIRGTPPLYADELVESWVSQRPAAQIYDVVLVFSGTGRASVQEGFDSPLCREGEYRPLTAEPPFS